MSLRGFSFILVLIVFFVSCTKERTNVFVPSTKRTLIVYLAGDNSLSSYLKAELEGYREGYKDIGTNVLVYTDPADAPPALILIKNGDENIGARLDTLTKFPEENSASIATFRRVMDYARANYPADSYGLIFSSHASGWLPKYTLSYPNSVSSIGSDFAGLGNTAVRSEEIELIDFASAIDDHQFDFIVFNACFMTGAEVVYELRNKTQYILGSAAEMLADGFTPALRSSFYRLLDPSVPVEEALSGFAGDYYGLIMAQTGAFQSTTLSVVKTDKLPELASWVKSHALINQTFENISGLQFFDRPGEFGERVKNPRFFDLQQVVGQKVAPADTAGFSARLREVVRWKANTPWMFQGYNGFKVDRHCGLTTYLFQTEFTGMNNSYRSLAWYKDTR